MSAKSRILHLITRLELGGAQQNTLYCTEHHDRNRFDVELISGSGGILDGDAKDIPDADVQLVPYLLHPISPLRDFIALIRLARYFRKRGIDLVHTHSSKAGIVGRFAAFLAGVPRIVHTVHGWSFNDTQPAWRRRLYIVLERIAARVSDRLITVSACNRDTGLARGIGRPSQYEVIHSGIDIDIFGVPGVPRDEVREKLGIDPSEVLVGTVSNMKPQKAPLDFVHAAAMVYERNRSLRFIVAGDGELRGEAESLAAELGLSGVVQFLGWRRDVIDLFHAMDIFLLTSLFEGLPRTVLQSMAAGVPVVATAVDGTPEVVENGRTGLLVPPGNPDAAAEGVLRMVSDEALRERCVSEARRRLGLEFDIDRMVKDLDRLYLSLLET